MKFLYLAIKNALVKWWRSCTLGLFIFFITMVMIIFTAFNLAVENKVENVIIHALTGHIQIRAENSLENDMLDQYHGGWDNLNPLNILSVKKIKSVLFRQFPELRYKELVRQNVYLMNKQKRQQTMLIGINEAKSTYKQSFILSKGRFLSSGNKNELVMTEEQAKYLAIEVGDSIMINTKNRFGLNTEQKMTVVGIGNFILLSLFSYKACYTNIKSVRELIRYKQNEITDLILFMPDKKKVKPVIQKLSEELNKISLHHVLTMNDKLASEDLKMTSLIQKDKNLNESKVKISHYLEMGEIYRAVGKTSFVILNILIMFMLLIVSFLIVNLVYMMGIERYNEIGTLRALGFSRFRVVMIFMTEIMLITLIFALAGLSLSGFIITYFGGTGIDSPISAMDYIMGKKLFLEIELYHILATLAMILVFSALSSFYPAYKACSLKPSESLRSF